jgi:hypothetical protein
MDCPICFECIEGEKNKVVTDCGHTFHTNCLMKNIAHNGFDCPYCRFVMADVPESDADSDDDDSAWLEDAEQFYYDSETEEDIALEGARLLFQRAEETEKILPTIDEINNILVSEGCTTKDLLKVILTHYEEFYDHEVYDEHENDADVVIDNISKIINTFKRENEPNQLVQRFQNSDFEREEVEPPHREELQSIQVSLNNIIHRIHNHEL